MASYVYFKFKSQKEPQRVTIDGPHTDVWNLKREIINISRLGDGTDFDLKIYKENSNEGKPDRAKMPRFVPTNASLEYTDDTEIIPKDSTVLARRLPASAPGKGRAARYVSGKPPVSAKPSIAATSKPARTVNMDRAMTEEEKLKAMLQLTDAQWQQKQEEMSHETRVPMQGKPFNKKANIPEGEPPHGYICYRCGKKGHWIQACPTNDDANYDNKNRIKRTTGIPRSMLKKIDQADFDKLDDTQRQNLMVNAEGEYVFAQADEKAWKKHLEQVKASEAAQKKQQVGDKELQGRGLECPIDKRLFVDPMKTPCCGKTYCHDCIENALLENDLTCPGCETENISLERLEPDEETKKKIKEYEADKADTKQRSRSPTVAADSPTDMTSDRASRPGSRDGSGTPQSTNGSAKKRSASEVDGTTSSTSLAAPAMKRQKSGDAVSSSTPKPDGVPHAKKDGAKENSSTPETANAFPANIMPPDFSQMQQGNNMNLPMMPGFNPFMMNPMMMGMGMNGMNGMNGMPGMNFMNPMMMNSMNPVNMGNMGMGMNFPDQNQLPNWNMNANQNLNQNQPGNFNKVPSRPNRNQNFQQQPKPSVPQQPAGLKGVPTGPKAMTQQAPANNFNQNQQNFYPPSGPSGNKFSNQQRHVGNEEDNAYMRQPVNPHRHNNRNKRPRQADYREL
ncbi:Protein mpe1 [Cladophialophora chaetospira]|uniref:peptidylprolyl isomerase n=1 Tax=Cladophialophora chaetospira TaxID=386627 RepID=A0AA38WXM6_9EURO|nr:Protein mpe1 [Cladophialophora chaetospira]